MVSERAAQAATAERWGVTLLGALVGLVAPRVLALGRIALEHRRSLGRRHELVDVRALEQHPIAREQQLTQYAELCAEQG